jgi:hypothetical protein
MERWLSTSVVTTGLAIFENRNEFYPKGAEFIALKWFGQASKVIPETK